jgi:hypothetical protein
LLCVADNAPACWEKRYFSHYDETSETIYCFCRGTTSQSSKGGTASRKYAKLCKDAKSIIQWHKNTGKKPDCEKVLIKYNCEDLIVGSSTKEHNWKIGDGDFNIKEYAIIA